MTENAITLSDFVIKATLNEGEGKNPPLTSVNKESMPLVQSGKTAEKTNDRLIKVVTAEREGHHHAPHTPDQPDNSVKAKMGKGEGCTRTPSPFDTNLQMINTNAYVGCQLNRYYLPAAAEQELAEAEGMVIDNNDVFDTGEPDQASKSYNKHPTLGVRSRHKQKQSLLVKATPEGGRVRGAAPPLRIELNYAPAKALAYDPDTSTVQISNPIQVVIPEKTMCQVQGEGGARLSPPPPS